MLGTTQTKADSLRRRPGRRFLPNLILTCTGLLALAALAAGCSSSSTPATTTSAPSTSSTTTPRLSAAAVRVLQAGLAKVGCYTGKIDGVSGPLTTQAVRAFQTASGLTVDGVYGALTKSKLLAADGTGTRVCPSPSSTTTTSTPGTTTTAPSFPGVPPAVVTAITSYESSHGPRRRQLADQLGQAVRNRSHLRLLPDRPGSRTREHRAGRLRIRPFRGRCMERGGLRNIGGGLPPQQFTERSHSGCGTVRIRGELSRFELIAGPRFIRLW